MAFEIVILLTVYSFRNTSTGPSLSYPLQDLKSSNMLEVAMALIIICKLIGAEMIPPLLPLVQDKMMHPK